MAFLLAGVAPMALSLFSETYAKDGIKSLGNLYCQIVGFASYLTIPIYVFCVLLSIVVSAPIGINLFPVNSLHNPFL